MTIKRAERATSATPALRLLTLVVFGLLITLGQSRAALGQQPWSTPDASNNINNTNTGNVGVGTGTATPAARLDVKGATSDGSAAAMRISNSSAASLFFVRNDGNVGIGTAAPNYSLVVGPEMQSGFSFATMTVSKGANASSSIIVGAGGSSALEFGWDNNNARGFTNTPGTTPFVWTQNGANVRMAIDSSGNVGIGTASPDPQYKLDVAGSIKVSGNINAKFQDMAEWVPADKLLPAATVVVLDSAHNNRVTTSSQAYDTRVAGVVSAQPGITLGEAGEGKLLVATTGRVKVKVDATRAPIKIGDLLVTSDVPGVAMKSIPVELAGRLFHAPGTIIGKALEPLDKGTGEILVLLSLQ